MKKSVGVDGFLEALEHPMKDGIVAVRAALLKAGRGGVTERVKWNAPSFCWEGDDRVTFRLPPSGDGAQLVFHRGAKVKAAKGFAFDDASGLIAWAAPDRGVVTFTTVAEMKKKAPTIAKLALAWMHATS